MAKVTIKIKKPNGATFKSWAFVLFAGLLLAAIAVVQSGRLGPITAAALVPAADGSTGCQFRVTVSETVNGRRVLNVRSAPDLGAAIVTTLDDGTLVDTVGKPTNGFRQLEGGNNWASANHLTLVSGNDCG